MNPDTHRILLANTSPRYRRLERLNSWVLGNQYDGKPSWWDGEVPLWDRAPCVVYPVARIAIESNVDLVLGEGRYPTFTTKPGEDEATPKESDREPDDKGKREPEIPEPATAENGLDEVDSVELDRFITEYHKLCQFRAHSREAFTHGQSVGTAVGVHGYRSDGKPFAELVEAKTCTGTWNDERTELVRLEIRYPYIDEFRDVDGTWKERVLLYRRVIDSANDTTYQPALAREDGTEPNWVADRTVPHKLGFCPVVWYAFNKGCQPVNVVDGNAIHALLTDEIQALDIALSQRHRCALMSEPQICEIGVTPGFSPTETGRTALVHSTQDGGLAGPNNPRTGAYVETSRAMPARKKGSGHVWQYPDPATKVEAITIGGDALQAQADNAQDLKDKLEDSLAVVLLDANNLKFATTTSGKALEALKQRQIDRCDQYRDDLRDRFLIPSVQMQLRIASKAGASLKVPGIDRVVKILQQFEKAQDAGTDAVAA